MMAVIFKDAGDDHCRNAPVGNHPAYISHFLSISKSVPLAIDDNWVWSKNRASVNLYHEKYTSKMNPYIWWTPLSLPGRFLSQRYSWHKLYSWHKHFWRRRQHRITVPWQYPQCKQHLQQYPPGSCLFPVKRVVMATGKLKGFLLMKPVDFLERCWLNSRLPRGELSQPRRHQRDDTQCDFVETQARQRQLLNMEMIWFSSFLDTPLIEQPVAYWSGVNIQ